MNLKALSFFVLGSALIWGTARNVAALQSSGGNPGDIKVVVDCDASLGVSGTGNIEYSDELCSEETLTDAELLLEANSGYSMEVQEGYRCKSCGPGAGRCAQGLFTYDPFVEDDCTFVGPFTADCDSDGEDEYEYFIYCSTAGYSHTYRCDACP